MQEKGVMQGRTNNKLDQQQKSVSVSWLAYVSTETNTFVAYLVTAV